MERMTVRGRTSSESCVTGCVPKAMTGSDRSAVGATGVDGTSPNWYDDPQLTAPDNQTKVRTVHTFRTDGMTQSVAQ